MKSIVMNAQDAREFEMLGGLTITKPIKPAPRYIERAEMLELAPGAWSLAIKGQEEGEDDLHTLGASDGVADVFAPPVQTGDIVFIREPWIRLKDAATGEPSDRVIRAADSTATEGQTSYKWASPVSMPESAACRFAVVRKVEPIYNENVAVWSITLEAVTKAAAESGEAGALPYSSAIEPEEGSNYFTYAGDMSPEDHERMVAAATAAVLADIQDRLIEIVVRRREIALKFGAGIADEAVSTAMTEEDSVIATEQGALEDQEAELRRALEDAGAPSHTMEEHARKKLTEIRSRLEEIAAAESFGTDSGKLNSSTPIF